MIKINKPQTIPNSLQSKKTQQRRQEVIAAGQYPKTDTINYDNRYRHKDIKQALEALYQYKCAYCESRENTLQVEHYRPKNIYYWLAYSWDNLLLACAACNSVKKDHFTITVTKIIYQDSYLAEPHQLIDEHNTQEKPLLLNPEVKQDALLFQNLIFNEQGQINSENERCHYTIETCHLDREKLNHFRCKILDDLRKQIQRILRIFIQRLG